MITSGYASTHFIQIGLYLFPMDLDTIFTKISLFMQTPQPDGASAIAATQSYQPDHQYALLEFERPVVSSLHSVAIGSKLDVDTYTYPETWCI